MIGHSGMRYSSPLVLVGLNPLFACLLFTGTAHSPTDHQLHHERGRHNLSLYFRRVQLSLCFLVCENRNAPELQCAGGSQAAAANVCAQTRWAAATVCCDSCSLTDPLLLLLLLLLLLDFTHLSLSSSQALG
jgi:hypothetical protein